MTDIERFRFIITTKAVLKICIGDKGYFEPTKEDNNHVYAFYSEDFIDGRGTKSDPFRYHNAAPVSNYYTIIDLWFQYRRRVAKRKTPIFIGIGDLIFEVTSEGVVTSDGFFTKLNIDI